MLGFFLELYELFLTEACSFFHCLYIQVELIEHIPGYFEVPPLYAFLHASLFVFLSNSLSDTSHYFFFFLWINAKQFS